MEAYMKEIGVVLDSRELGVNEDILEGLAESTVILKGGYKVLTHDDIIRVFRESMRS